MTKDEARFERTKDEELLAAFVDELLRLADGTSTVAVARAAGMAYAQAAVDKFKADTLGLRSSLSQMVFWAICYQQDSKESTFMDAGHKKWIAREIAGAEALLGKEKK